MYIMYICIYIYTKEYIYINIYIYIYIYIKERKRKAVKLTQICQLDVHFSLFQGQDKDLTDAQITSILTTTESIFNYIYNYIADYIKSSFYHIRILLNNTTVMDVIFLDFDTLPNFLFIKSETKRDY